MLIEFSVSNFRSILGKQTFSMVAGIGDDHEERNVISNAETNDRVLRSAAIYGPNAAGKSNLLRAILTLQQLVLTTASSQEGVPMAGITPFLLDSDSANLASEFNIVFIVEDGVKYEYYFSATSRAVEKEWLVAYPNGRPQRWFERQINKETEKYEWWFGAKFKGDKAEKKVWSEFTRSNSLFFSTAIQLNNEQLKPCFNWIANKLIVLTSGMSLNPFLSINLLKENKAIKILDYMQAADMGIDGIGIREEDFSPNTNPMMRPSEFKPNSDGSLENWKGMKPKIIQVVTSHKDNKNEFVHFSLDDESEGTKKLFEFTGGWIRALDLGATLLVDELEKGLHTHITKFLVDLFHRSRNAHHAQLIFTTHDTNLLDSTLLRRDQIWFVEKNPQKASELYSLLEYKPRKDEAIERGYLRGKYGAIPLIGDL